MQVTTQFRAIARRGAVAVAALAVAGSVAVTSASAATAHPHASGGKIHFLLTASDDKHQTGIISGAITGGGPSVSHDQYDVAKLNGGTFRLNHPDKDGKFTFKVDPKTCFATFTESGKFTISNGTGRFKGYTGRGTYSGYGEGILKRTKAGKCNMQAEPIASAFVVKGSGTVTTK